MLFQLESDKTEYWETQQEDLELTSDVSWQQRQGENWGYKIYQLLELSRSMVERILEDKREEYLLCSVLQIDSLPCGKHDSAGKEDE